MAEDESESPADIIRKHVSILGRPRPQAAQQNPLSASASGLASSLGVPAAAVGQGGSGSARTNTGWGSAVDSGYNPPPPHVAEVPAAPLMQSGLTYATTPGTQLGTEIKTRIWNALLLLWSCTSWVLSCPLRVVQGVKAYLLSMVRSFLFTLATVYIVIYICIYLFQIFESTYKPPPALEAIGIKSGLFTGCIHEYLCWPLTVPVQVPGFKICPSQPVFFFLPSASSQDKVSRDVNSGDGMLSVMGNGSSLPHWALENKGLYRGPWAYATLENVDAAFNSNGTCIADIRHANSQDDIRFWEDKEREYKLLRAEMLTYIADDKAFRAAAASENPRHSSSSFFDIYTQVNAVRVLVGLLIEQLRGLDSLSMEFESVLIPAINSPRPPTTHPRVDVHSSWWQFWSDWGGERKAQEAREQAEKAQVEKEYRYMMRSLRQILKELERLLEKANAVVRELEGLEGGGVREVLRMVAQDEKRQRAERKAELQRKAEQQRDMAGPWRWSGLVRRARMWMPLFFAVDEDAAVLEDEDTEEMAAHRACEMLLLVRVKELSAKTARSFVYLDALIKSRRVEMTELSRYTTEEGLEAVKSGHLGLWQNLDRILFVSERRQTDQVRERRAIMKAIVDDGDEIREKKEE